MKFLTSFLVLASLSATALAAVEDFVPTGKIATSITLSDGSFRVFYQANDTSIHFFRPYGLPGTSGYDEKAVIAAGKAKANSPLAAIINADPAGKGVLLYYFDNSNNLQEASGTVNGTSWSDTGYGDYYRFKSIAGNQLLYAVNTANNGRRVGFQFASGALGEAILVGGGHSDWYTATY